MIVEFHEDHMTASMVGANGIIRTKVVDVNSLLESLSYLKTTGFGLLPKNTRIIESNSSMITIGLEFEKTKRSLRYLGTGGVTKTIKDVACPAGLVLLTFKKDGSDMTLRSSSIYAIFGNRIISESDRLFRMPFPNVYEDGRICWGMVVHAPIQTLSAIEGIAGLFFGGIFNRDLFNFGCLSSSYNGPREVGDVEKYLNHLSKQPSFDDRWLSQSSHTFKSAVAKALKES